MRSHNGNWTNAYNGSDSEWDLHKPKKAGRNPQQHLVNAMGTRPVMWSDPTFPGSFFRYQCFPLRFVLQQTAG